MCFFRHDWLVLKAPDDPVYSGCMEYRTQVSWQVPTPIFLQAGRSTPLPNFLHLPMTWFTFESSFQDRYCVSCGKLQLNLQKRIKEAVAREDKLTKIKQKMPAYIEMFWRA